MTTPASSLPLLADSLPAKSDVGYPEPFKTRMGVGDWRRLADAFDLTQFGVNLETLQPGAESSLRHWHTLEDEFLYLLEGELVLRTNDGETPMTAGMCVGFKAGERNAHHFVNRSNAPARYLVIGSRIKGDFAFYPDDDLMRCVTENGSYAAHKDGTPYPKPDQT